MSDLRKTAKKSTFFALEPLFLEIFENEQNRRVLHVRSFPEPYYMLKFAKKWPSYAKKKKTNQKNYVVWLHKPYIDFFSSFFFTF